MLAVLGSRVPPGAKVFLLTLAIVDDILAITVIAVFYTGQLAVGWLAVAAAGMGLVLLLRQLGVHAISAYVPLGVLVWLATLQSGAHATIAGVALGLATPARPVGGRPVLEQLQHRLHPLSSYLVIPLFALANAGVPLGGDALGRAARSPVAWGVALGLLAGKILGVAAASLAAVRLRVGALPDDLTMRHVLGLAAPACSPPAAGQPGLERWRHESNQTKRRDRPPAAPSHRRLPPSCPRAQPGWRKRATPRCIGCTVTPLRVVGASLGTTTVRTPSMTLASTISGVAAVGNATDRQNDPPGRSSR